MKPIPTIGLADKKPAAERGQELAAQRLAAIVKSSDDAILSKDLNGIITSWNKGAERIFGYTEEETLGKPVTMLMPPERHNEESAILAPPRHGERVDHYETVRQRKDPTASSTSPSQFRRSKMQTGKSLARRKSPVTSPSANVPKSGEISCSGK